MTKFALKRLNEPDGIEAFNLELASLLPFQSNAGWSLIQVLATFEILENGARYYYFLFPYADGTLWDFFKRFDEPSKPPSHTERMMYDCHALAEALTLIHNSRLKQVGGIPGIADGEENELYGRHGDIKADNILYFYAENSSRLVITDFGLGRLHTGISRSRQNPRNLDFSSTYRAPEFDVTDGKIGRKADVYSLGCVFLEMVTWDLKGFTAARDLFAKARATPNEILKGFVEDTFFTCTKTSGERVVAKRKPEVDNWIKDLRTHPKASRCSNEFLDLIEKMLEPEVSERLTSQQVLIELKTRLKVCIDHPKYSRPQKY